MNCCIFTTEDTESIEERRVVAGFVMRWLSERGWKLYADA